MPTAENRKPLLWDDKKFKKIPPEDLMERSRAGRIPYGWILFLALAAGMIGGMMSLRLAQGHAFSSASLAANQPWVIRDASGREKAFVKTDAEGRITISWSAEGTGPKMVLDQGEHDVPSLTLVDGEGRSVMTLGGQGDASSGILVQGKQGPAVELTLSQQGYPTLRMSQEENRAKLKLGISSDGTKGLFFYRDQDEPDAVFMQTGDGLPVMRPFPAGGLSETKPQVPAAPEIPPASAAPRGTGGGQTMMLMPISAESAPPAQKIETIKGVYSQTLEHCEGGAVC